MTPDQYVISMCIYCWRPETNSCGCLPKAYRPVALVPAWQLDSGCEGSYAFNATNETYRLKDVIKDLQEQLLDQHNRHSNIMCQRERRHQDELAELWEDLKMVQADLQYEREMNDCG